MIHHWISLLAQYSSVVGFLIGLPAVIGTYYQSYKARQEARREREGTLHSQDCLEFVAGDGDCINLIPLETLHSLPRAGDVIMLPGEGPAIFPARIWWSRWSIFTLMPNAKAAGRKRRD